MLEGLLVDGFAVLLKAGAASLDRVAQDGMRARASAFRMAESGIAQRPKHQPAKRDHQTGRQRYPRARAT